MLPGMIMCSSRMWRVVRDWDHAPDEGHECDAVLGPWAATTLAVDGRKLVLAVEASTYLTVTFELDAVGTFSETFARSVECILQDIDVPAPQIAPEMIRVRSARFTRLRDPELGEYLRTLEYMCDIELLHHTDLRRVQVNLSEYPHAPPPHYVGTQNARWLFAQRPTARA